MAYYRDKQRLLKSKREQQSAKKFFYQPPSSPQKAHQSTQSYGSQSSNHITSFQEDKNLPNIGKKRGDPKNLEKLMEIRADRYKSLLKKKSYPKLIKNSSVKKHGPSPNLYIYEHLTGKVLD
jgi:hypothetical protein